MLFSFSKKYEKSLLQNGHILVALLPVENESSKIMSEAAIWGRQEAIYSYSSSQVLNAEESKQVKSGKDKGEEDPFFAPVYAHILDGL